MSEEFITWEPTPLTSPSETLTPIENFQTVLPDDFIAGQYDTIPPRSQKLFPDGSPEMEKKARELITASLEKRLGTPVVSREIAASRYGLRNRGYTLNDVMAGRVAIR